MQPENKIDAADIETPSTGPAVKPEVVMKPKFTVEHTKIYKGIAVLLMLMHHLFEPIQEYPGPLSHALGFNLTHEFYLYAKICVAIFTLMSGYGMSLSFKSREAGRLEEVALNPASNHARATLWNATPSSKSTPWRDYFYAAYSYASRSTMKLLTTFWMAYLLSFVYTWAAKGSLSAFYQGPHRVPWLFDFLGLANYLGVASINGPWWYVNAAVVYFLLFPWLYALAKRFPKFSLLLSIGCTGVLFVYYDSSFIPYLVNLVIFFLGISAAHNDLIRRYFVPSGERKCAGKVLQFLFVVGAWVGLLLIRHLVIGDQKNYYVLDGFLALLGCYGIAFISRFKLLKGFFLRLGEISTELFLTHALVIRLAPEFLYMDVNPYYVTLRCLLLAVPLGLLLRALTHQTPYKRFRKFMAGEEISQLAVAFYVVCLFLAVFCFRRAYG